MEKCVSSKSSPKLTSDASSESLRVSKTLPAVFRSKTEKSVFHDREKRNFGLAQTKHRAVGDDDEELEYRHGTRSQQIDHGGSADDVKMTESGFSADFGVGSSDSTPSDARACANESQSPRRQTQPQMTPNEHKQHSQTPLTKCRKCVLVPCVCVDLRSSPSVGGSKVGGPKVGDPKAPMRNRAPNNKSNGGGNNLEPMDVDSSDKDVSPMRKQRRLTTGAARSLEPMEHLPRRTRKKAPQQRSQSVPIDGGHQFDITALQPLPKPEIIAKMSMKQRRECFLQSCPTLVITLLNERKVVRPDAPSAREFLSKTFVECDSLAQVIRVTFNPMHNTAFVHFKSDTPLQILGAVFGI